MIDKKTNTEVRFRKTFIANFTYLLSFMIFITFFIIVFKKAFYKILEHTLGKV
jgi:hypothetical protein